MTNCRPISWQPPFLHIYFKKRIDFALPDGSTKTASYRPEQPAIPPRRHDTSWTPCNDSNQIKLRKMYAGMVNENTTAESAASAALFRLHVHRLRTRQPLPGIRPTNPKFCRDADLPTIARAQDCEYHCISKCLDMGADGVMIPRTETMSQVKLAIDSMRFHPRGRKGIGGAGLFRKGEKFEEINDNRLLILQIESPLGIATLDAMLTVYGHEVAGVVIGPCDLACMCGYGIDTECEAVKQHAQTVIKICQRHSKPSGIYCSMGNIGHYYKSGMSILWMLGDGPFHTGGDEAMAAQRERLDKATA